MISFEHSNHWDCVNFLTCCDSSLGIQVDAETEVVYRR